jgi:hypothetical protein
MFEIIDNQDGKNHGKYLTENTAQVYADQLNSVYQENRFDVHFVPVCHSCGDQ